MSFNQLQIVWSVLIWPHGILATVGSWKFFHSEYCNTLVLRLRLILNDKIFSIGIGIVIEFSKLRYWYWYLYWFSKSGVLVLKLVSISEIWNIEIDIGIETWFFRIKYWYWLIRAGIAHLWFWKFCAWLTYQLDWFRGYN